jgi:cell division protein FtsQ
MDNGNQKAFNWTKGNLPAWTKMLVAVAVVLLFVLVFFRVRSFEVTGNVRYTVQEIADASGVAEGDILMGVNKTRTAGRLLTKLPYLEQVEISKALPGTVRFQVVECSAQVMASSEFSSNWLLSGSGKLLEEADESAENAYPLITGTELLLPTAGDMAQFDDVAKGELAMTLAKEIESVGLSDAVTEINVEDLDNVSIIYEDRLELRLGDGSDGTYKLQYFQEVLGKLDPEAQGVVDLSFSAGETAIFHPLG